jgi:hypothetical protein
MSTCGVLVAKLKKGVFIKKYLRCIHNKISPSISSTVWWITYGRKFGHEKGGKMY